MSDVCKAIDPSETWRKREAEAERRADARHIQCEGYEPPDLTRLEMGLRSSCHLDLENGLNMRRNFSQDDQNGSLHPPSGGRDDLYGEVMRKKNKQIGAFSRSKW